MALQAEMWTRFPKKLNRSYFNLKENLELQSDPDAVTPGYFEELGAIRTPWGENDGGKWYLTPDLPSLRFRSDLAQVTGTGEDGLDPIRMVSDMAPAIKVPVEMAMNRELFTDIPFKNRLYDYDDEGNPTARRATDILQGEIPGTDFEVPVVGSLIKNAADIALRDNAELVNGELLIQDNAESAIEDFVPLVGRAARLLPNNEKFESRANQSRISFAGLPARQNTVQSMRGELYGRQIDQESDARQRAIDELLESLTK